MVGRTSGVRGAAAEQPPRTKPVVRARTAVLLGVVAWAVCMGLTLLLSHGHLPFRSAALAGLTRAEIFFPPLIGLGVV